MKEKINNHKKLFITICIIVLVLIICVIGAIFAINKISAPVDRNNTDFINVTIENGSGTGQIGETLEDAGLIKSVNGFKIISRLKGYDGQYKAGIYSLSKSMSMNEIAEIIISGDVKTNIFTIPEGFTINQTAEKLSEEKLINKEKFLSLIKKGNFDYKFLEKAQKGKNHLEGYLFPSTYQIPIGATEKEIIETMLNQFNLIFKKDYYEQAKKLGLSINDVIVVASIIERECRVDSERPKIASVIYNRIKQNMPLQMCSTVQYVLGKQKETLSYSDTEIDSPYNTYKTTGLPPGPICSPGEASIKASLYPDNTDYIYFVVSEKLDGSHNFSSEYKKFLKDKDAYYKALEANN